MRIQIRCFATLHPFQPADADAFPADPGETVAGLLARLSIRAEDTKLIFVNGGIAGLDTVLRDGDRVGVFPAVGGG
jgi:molybdopterin converting factor small subunit